MVSLGRVGSQPTHLGLVTFQLGGAVWPASVLRLHVPRVTVPHQPCCFVDRFMNQFLVRGDPPPKGKANGPLLSR
jgi:hypothetical protein